MVAFVAGLVYVLVVWLLPGRVYVCVVLPLFTSELRTSVLLLSVTTLLFTSWRCVLPSVSLTPVVLLLVTAFSDERLMVPSRELLAVVADDLTDEVGLLRLSSLPESTLVLAARRWP